MLSNNRKVLLMRKIHLLRALNSTGWTYTATLTWQCSLFYCGENFRILPRLLKIKEMQRSLSYDKPCYIILGRNRGSDPDFLHVRWTLYLYATAAVEIFRNPKKNEKNKNEWTPYHWNFKDEASSTRNPLPVDPLINFLKIQQDNVLSFSNAQCLI